MTKRLFSLAILALAICLISCSGNDDSTTPVQNINTTQLLGKWIIYKAVYGEGTAPLLYESNGVCGKEILQFTSDGEVSETVYVDNDCYNDVTGTFNWWLQDGKIALGAQNSYHHTVSVDGNNLILDATEEADYIKYYHKAN